MNWSAVREELMGTYLHSKRGATNNNVYEFSQPLIGATFCSKTNAGRFCCPKSEHVLGKKELWFS